MSPAGPPSGQQFVLAAGGYRATVVEVGGGLRTLSRDGVDVLDGYPESERAAGGRGQILVPWPNRLRDGRWSYRDSVQHLPLSEPDTMTAIHGLVRWMPWQLREHSADSVRLGLVLPEQPGWPGTLECEVTYRLDDSGLSTRLAARNLSAAALPVGLGMHPYLAAGAPDALVDDCRLDLPVTVQLNTDERGLPTTTTPVTPWRDERIGDRKIDSAFGGLQPDGGADEPAAGTSTVVLHRADGRRTTVTLGPTFRWVMIFTGDTLAPPRRRHGLAVEPMTCPPDALASGEDLLWLEPGERVDAQWWLSISDPGPAGR